MSLTNDIASLQRVQLFSEFNEEQLRLIAFGGQKLQLPEGMELFHNGQTADGGFVVLSGEISLEINHSEKSSNITVFGPGSLIGEMSLFTRNRRIGTASVTENSEVLKIRRDVMHRVLSEYPELAARLHDHIADNIVSIGRELDRVGKRLERMPES
ncbi:MAG: cyclic nucleotide-binding domain-containing protein [Rhizobiaceae bacterium]|nr:cyclic nucleotide-binding domain-containing protein [Rhizobiaceae bacterium]